MQVIFLALMKFFLTNPTLFSIGYANVQITDLIRIIFLSAHSVNPKITTIICPTKHADKKELRIKPNRTSS